MDSANRAYSESIRDTVDILSNSLRRCTHTSLNETLSPSQNERRALVLVGADPRLVAWEVVSIWLTGVATNNLCPTATLKEAEEWFLEDSNPKRITGMLSAPEIREVERALPYGMNPNIIREHMPYILDPHGPGSRLSVKRDPKTGVARTYKRAHGVFYTPMDVAKYMVNECLDLLDPDCHLTILDPACGTGVFLRTSLRELIRRRNDVSAFELASMCLFGVDVSPLSLNATAFVLLAEVLAFDVERTKAPQLLWGQLRGNLACIDALLVDPVGTKSEPRGESPRGNARVQLSELFPAMKENPTVIVGNPPYAERGTPLNGSEVLQQLETLRVKPGPSAEIYVAFIEQMIRLANVKNCASSLVLPLSIASNVGSQFATVRRLIQQTAGEWRFAFFDREPQALFGEDVKTRNAILFWHRDPHITHPSIATGPLRRWRRDTRGAMFKDIGFTPLIMDITGGIPKVEGIHQASALSALTERWDRLELAVRCIKRIRLAETTSCPSDIVFVGSTAYNFLNVFLRPPQDVFKKDVHLSENQLYAIHCATTKHALAVFAMLTSHLAYWWWHTQGDGFHASRRFLLGFPFGKDVLVRERLNLLAEIGLDLWSAMGSNPTMSLNRGRTSLAYNPIQYASIRRSADHVLVDAAGLDDDFVDELQRFNEHMIAAVPRHRSDRQRLLKG